MEKNLNHTPLMLLLVVLVAVGQMAQTVYVPALSDIAISLQVSGGNVQGIMAAYLITYGLSQLFYGPLSDSIGRRPVILSGLLIFCVGAVAALLAGSINQLVIGCAIQGMGTGVAGVMARTLPRDIYSGGQLRKANSVLNMGILISPLLAPVIGAVLTKFWGWHACFAFLLVLCLLVMVVIACRLPETRPEILAPRPFLSRYSLLLRDAAFLRYLVILIGALAGIAVFEASCGVLMGGVLGLSRFTVSILFILPIPAAFFGAWYVRRSESDWYRLMWLGVSSCLLAGVLMWIPGWFHVMNIWTLLVPAALYFFGAGMLFPLATSGAMEPYAWVAGSAGALIGGLQNLGSGGVAWLSAKLPQNDQFSLGMLMFMTSLLMLLCWWSLSRQRESDHQIVAG